MHTIELIKLRCLFKALGYTALITVLLSPWHFANAEEYSLIIQPTQSPQTTEKTYQSLVEYLSKVTQHKIRLTTARNFVSYWQRVRKGDRYDLILDAAHFTDYRIKHQNYAPLVKLSNATSYTLVSHQDEPILTPKDLLGKRVAVLPSPSLGAVLLAQLFPNPLQQPTFVEVRSPEDAVKMVEKGMVSGAIIPSDIVKNYKFLSKIKATKKVPQMALSASPKVPRELRSTIRDALINAKISPEGQHVLEDLALDSFEPADAKMYDGYATLLRGVFGYKNLESK